jgi:hypothetical protein
MTTPLDPSFAQVSDRRSMRENPSTRTAILAFLASAALSLGALTPQAGAAFGDNFDIGDVNTSGAPTAPAFPSTPTFPASTPKAWWAGACDLASSAVDVGVAPAAPRDCIDWGSPNRRCTQPVDDGACFPMSTIATSDIWAPGAEPAWRLAGASQAGGHPDGSATFSFKRNGGSASAFLPIRPDGSVDNIAVDLPPGFVGSPAALPKCTAEQFSRQPVRCPPETQVGISTILLESSIPGFSESFYPVYNLEPREGYTAEFGIPDAGDGAFTTVRVVAKARTSSDFGVTGRVTQIPAALALWGQAFTLWGVPWASSHDKWRMPEGAIIGNRVCTIRFSTGFSIPPNGLSPSCQRSYNPSWGPIRPFFSNITACDGVQPTTRLNLDTFQHPGAFTPDGMPDLSDPDWLFYDSPAPAVGECDKPPFDPSADFAPTSTKADSASGLGVDITVPQNDDPPAGVATNPNDATGAPAFWKSPAGRATSHLDKTVVKLPAGMAVNPSGATGLAGCSDAQIGLRQLGNPPLFNDEDPFDDKGVECPDGSVIGTARVDTPLLDEPLTGEMVLGNPKSTDPMSGEMFRLFLVVRDRERGLVAKIFGSAVADPGTGQVTATFDNNPKVPFEDLHIDVKGGSRGMLAMPQTCGARSIDSVFTPWTAVNGGGGVAKSISSPFVVGGDCSRSFAPSLRAGMDNPRGRGTGAFSFSFARTDGQRWFRGLTAELPAGLLASVKDVPLCTSAQSAAGSCPAASRIGSVDAGAGSGAPFFLEKKGDAYLTEGYKGAPYGLLVRVPVEAGPFRGQFALKPIIVRQALHVDRTDASVTAVSDQFPEIWHGVPLRVRQVTVKVDRAGFMLNPSDCSAKRIDATLSSVDGPSVGRSQRFQATSCAALPFTPKLGLTLTGRRQVKTGKHPGVKAQVTQTVGEAGIRRAEVRLPKSLALDPDNAQALCEYADGTKPDLENHCPKGSIVGRARAVSPLLKRPLAGNVYFVKNVRRSSTGNLIRTLPMIVVALRGEIAINLKGESSTTKAGNLVNTFNGVPDAPVSRFNLNIKGGSTGILAVTRTRRGKINLCSGGRHLAEADMDGHNNRLHDRTVTMRTPCRAKRKTTRK